MLHDVVQHKKFYTLVLQKCLTRSAINEIPKPRHRAALVMSYILPEKIQIKEQAQRLRIAESTYYLDKALALMEFAKRYRNGILDQDKS